MTTNPQPVGAVTAVVELPAEPARLSAPWLQTQLEALLLQRGHAWLLSGPSGLGQFELALGLARAWLCDHPTRCGACGKCGSCHAVAVHTHADLCVLLPETLSLSLGWPLDEKTQDDLDGKKRKPSKEIKVDAARDAVAFSQFTRSRGTTKVVLVFPAERMNTITANTLLKTLEEPPGSVKFVLATEAAHQLLPTIRSRCLGHTMLWPNAADAVSWLERQAITAAATNPDGATAQLPVKTRQRAVAPPAELSQLQTLLKAAGGRPAHVLSLIKSGSAGEAARHWQALPAAMARGDAGALMDWPPPQAVEALQKICHDVCLLEVGASPRFFEKSDLPLPSRTGNDAEKLAAYASWSKELAAIARTVDHPYNPGLLIESLVSRAQVALGGA